ncbi:hypothetical protein JEY03_11565 [Pseudomonas aeruginosa]|nr:hypothetical protein [Pseudomonas aeruginosa]EKS3059493.1 hypothetical protein [Pseudomonas aeruginosa]EKU4838732.1 hypothetical protein [Pseudomonas aeruginosa]EKU5976177.1 hypothetical protein [Pseudomonas aeruginosa]EKX6188405.1 hypothetical protein [Pseudomonas aeruginosa]ELL1256049.1 hypothetical protein [Pseudomonas aeruginosa]
MRPGDAIPCRCPKCRSTDLTLFEQFTVCDVITVAGGKMQDRHAGEFPELTGRVFGECANPACRHRWQFRRSPLMAAFEAANAKPPVSHNGGLRQICPYRTARP